MLEKDLFDRFHIIVQFDTDHIDPWGHDVVDFFLGQIQHALQHLGFVFIDRAFFFHRVDNRFQFITGDGNRNITIVLDKQGFDFEEYPGNRGHHSNQPVH